MKAFLATVLLLTAPAAFAQTYSAAPPLAQLQGQGQTPTDFFSWQETPQGQPIPIVRAVFDSSGYVLFDENGQAISVPFAGNLYAMQFGKTNGSMYFVNEAGSVPTLYVPNNGYLENAVVSGARWYPFPQRYFYTRPVYLGPAPSWDAYSSMGWYPGMAVYGGYWGYQPWRTGIVYSPMSCLTISIGTRICNTWDDFCLFGRSYTSVRPIVIRDTRPIFIERRDSWDRSRNNGKSYDRPVFREPSRPGFSAPARHSEERAQGQGGSDRFNYGNPNSGSGRSEGASREHEFRGTQPTPRELPQNRPITTPPLGGGSSSGGSREREYSRPTVPSNVPNMTPIRPGGSYIPPSGGGQFGSREREITRPGNGNTPGYSVPNMTPVRPSFGNGSGMPPAGSREREFSRGPEPSRGPVVNRGSEPARTRTFEPARESRGSSSGPSRESSSRERERGKR